MKRTRTDRRVAAVTRQHDMQVAATTAARRGERPGWAYAPVGDFTAGEDVCDGLHADTEPCEGGAGMPDD